MTDTQVLLAVCASVGGLLGWLLKALFKNPRELQGDVERRVSSLETLVAALSLKVEGTYSRHDEALENLTEAMKTLTSRLDRFMETRTHVHTGGR